MDFFLALAFFACSMVLCLLLGVSMLWALLSGLVGFLAVGVRRGFSLRALCGMALRGGKRAVILLRIFALVGMITALWRASGTIASCICWGIEAITPHCFLLIAFLLTSLVSYALGTSLGVAGTVGVIFMSLARSGGVNPAVAAGVIFSGVYVGDRGAPTSSCANLVAAVTGTDITDNVRAMFKSAALPYLLTLCIYAALSYLHPITAVDESLLAAISGAFRISLWTLLPALLALALPLCGVPVIYALLASILAAAGVAIGVQGMAPLAVLRCAVLGFSSGSAALGRIFDGGGLVSMVKVACIILLSSTYFGIFEGTGMFAGVEQAAQKLAARVGRFPAMLLCALGLCAVFCNQAVGVMMSNELFAGVYDRQGAPKGERMLDLENSAVVLAGVIPWCIASSGPLEILGADASAIPYGVFLYILPLYWLLYRLRQYRKMANSQTLAQTLCK